MEKKSKKILILGSAAGFIVLAAAAGTGLYFYMKKQNGGGNGTDTDDNLSILKKMLIGGMPNLITDPKLDNTARTGSLVIQPFSANLTQPGFIVSSPVPDAIAPPVGVHIEITSIVDQVEVRSEHGVAYLHFIKGSGGIMGSDNKIVFVYSGNDSSGAKNTGHWWPFSAGKFELLQPITLKWNF